MSLQKRQHNSFDFVSTGIQDIKAIKLLGKTKIIQTSKQD